MKRIIIIASIIIITATLSLIVLLNFTRIIEIFGIKGKGYTDVNYGDVAILVNDSPIYKNEIEIALYALSQYKSGVEYEEARKEAIKLKIYERLLIDYAVKMGINVSSQEADELFNSNNDLLMKNEETKKSLYDYIEGLGISEDQYNKIGRKVLGESLSITKLILETYENGLYTGLYSESVDKFDVLNQVKEDLIKQLSQNIKIEYILNQYKS